jgi:predicted adenine nucleotide alpha hydrolase (AANH) superfamily ATPase
MNRRNYQKELDQIIKRQEASGEFPKLLLHACCAPCSTWCLEYLAPHFDITVFYYNPNIDFEEEYRKRVQEEKRLISEMPLAHPVHFLEGSYEPEEYHRLVKGHENDPEGGERCGICFRQRLMKTAETASQLGSDCFTTTLTISPLKDADRLNTIGEEAGKSFGVPFLPSDFKKKNGFLRSTQLSREYGLYRQDYCGCSYSRAEAGGRRQQSAAGAHW